jgi:hypothetical protein
MSLARTALSDAKRPANSPTGRALQDFNQGLQRHDQYGTRSPRA